MCVTLPGIPPSIADAIVRKQDVLTWKDVVRYDGKNYMGHMRSLDAYVKSNKLTSVDSLDALTYGTRCTGGDAKKIYDRLLQQADWTSIPLTVSQCLAKFRAELRVDLQDLRKPWANLKYPTKGSVADFIDGIAVIWEDIALYEKKGVMPIWDEVVEKFVSLLPQESWQILSRKWFRNNPLVEVAADSIKLQMHRRVACLRRLEAVLGAESKYLND